jgi:hypothetical protein
MLETVIGLVTSLAGLALKLYSARADAHDAIVKQFQDLQATANALEASLKITRDARDAASLAKLDALQEHHGVEAPLAPRLP